MAALMILAIPTMIAALVFFIYSLWTHNVPALVVFGTLMLVSVLVKIKKIGLERTWKEVKPLRTLGLYASIWFHVWPLIILFLLISIKFTSGRGPLIFGRNQ